MILMDDITRDGDPVLRQQAKAVTFPLSEEDKQLADEMMEYLVNSQDEELAEKYSLRPGVGYAAPQIGVSKQIIALFVPDLEDDSKPHLLDGVMYNPKILSTSVEKVTLRTGEGCLSVDDDIPGLVPRYARIRISYQDEEGNTHKKRYKGYAAIVLQHEIDHLKGKLYYDHINLEHPFEKDSNTFFLGEEY